MVDKKTHDGATSVATLSLSVVKNWSSRPISNNNLSPKINVLQDNVSMFDTLRGEPHNNGFFNAKTSMTSHPNNTFSKNNFLKNSGALAGDSNCIVFMQEDKQAYLKLSDNSIRLSFQLMTRAEPLDMVIATIQSLLAIKADDDEILIVDNNHSDMALYEPLEKFCTTLDAQLNVRFYHVDKVVGFKAGALNLALGLMDPLCTHVVVVDSDYQALSHARASITTAIENHPDHGLLQFPQFYRDANRTDVHSELNHYFNYHLHRPFNRQRALSTGTYAVIRRSALLALGGWSGASLTEDAQMGVLMHRQGLRSRFIPEVIATGLLPTTVGDLMNQRCRWIYGNAQVLNSYFSTHSLKRPTIIDPRERLAYMRAHLSQLSAWINFTGVFIVLHICTLLIVALALASGASLDVALLLTPLYAVYVGYGLFLGRRLWAYGCDRAPLNQQIDKTPAPNWSHRLRAWALHLNFWELGALSWLPVLWGQDKPFICTPKQEVVRTKRTVWMANISALPKLLFILNVITAVIVAPFSSLYSPLLFIFAVTVCFLKLWSAKVMLTNYGYIEPNAANIAVAHYHEEVVNKVVVRKPSQLSTTSFTKSKGSSSELPFKDDNIVNF